MQNYRRPPFIMGFFAGKYQHCRRRFERQTVFLECLFFKKLPIKLNRPIQSRAITGNDRAWAIIKVPTIRNFPLISLFA